MAILDSCLLLSIVTLERSVKSLTLEKGSGSLSALFACITFSLEVKNECGLVRVWTWTLADE